MKDIKDFYEGCSCGNHDDRKQLSELKRKIQRMGLKLARHAEENALSKYEASLGVRDRKPVARRKLHMVVIRINAEEELVDSKPCSNCVRLMRAFGIRKVTYSTVAGLITESLTTIESQPSVGQRSVERAISILDEMLDPSSESS
jgi:deoxycytidylate deaminase